MTNASKEKREISKAPISSGMAKAAVIVMSSIVLSRITGFLREMLIAYKIGRNNFSDAYIIGFTIPDLMYNLLVGGAISAALIPFLSGHIEKGEEKEGWRAASTFINIIFIGIVILSIAGMVFAPQLLPVFNRKYMQQTPEIQQLTVSVTRTLFPSVSFLMLAGICTGVLNSYRKFAAAAYGPTIYNIGSIISIMMFGAPDAAGIKKVAAGVAASAAVYFAFQFLSAHKELKHYRPVIRLKDNGFRNLFGQALPSIFSSSVVQINAIISISFVSLFAAGSVTAFRNANTTWQLPYGIFAMGIGTAMLPTLSRKLALGEIGEYRSLLMKSLKTVLFLSTPSAVAFIMLRYDIVSAIFSWGGQFKQSDVSHVAKILMVFSIAMITQSIVATMNRGFYAAGDTKTPLLVGIGTIFLNLFLGYVFTRYTSMEAEGMALSYSVISTVNAVMLLLLLNKKMKGIQLRKLAVFLKKAIPASLAMCGVLYLMNGAAPGLHTKILQLVYLTVEVSAGAAVYFFIMLYFRSEEAVYFLKTLGRKLDSLSKKRDGKELKT